MESEEFFRIWEENRHQMQCMILKITRNPDVAQDLLQDAFVRSYPHAQKLDDGAAKYLMRTAKNLAIQYQKRKKVWKMEYQFLDQVCEDTPHDIYCKRERDDLFSTRVMPAMRSLPARQQEALYARTIDVPQKEAARMLGIPYSTLRAREKKAILNVRKKIKRLYNHSELDP
jgi:RNA polymerase sigma factor (sigma-70 family)